jgi:hypothetical protein
MGSVQSAYKRSEFTRQVSSEQLRASRRRSEVGKLVVEDLQVGLWRLSVWLEDVSTVRVL